MSETQGQDDDCTLDSELEGSGVTGVDILLLLLWLESPVDIFNLLNYVQPENFIIDHTIFYL